LEVFFFSNSDGRMMRSITENVSGLR